MIYFLEDDDSIRKLVIYALESQGYEAQGFERPSAFWKQIDGLLPSLILLDIMLPEEDGISILKKLKASPVTAMLPVIMITAKNSEYDRVEGLDAGADDYIVKPFGMMELVARVRAVLRRSETDSASKEYKIGILSVSPERHEVRVGQETVNLTYKEFSLLCLLAENEGMVLSRTMLMDRIWNMETERENRTLDVHVRTLRAKLGAAGAYIETVRGVGYRIKGDGR
ncbi:MAG: response regulator transcription factor [Lachnospiraceae bacterium]|nr:response regulator transcription factor [Lachnospiraceae bacterium]